MVEPRIGGFDGGAAASDVVSLGDGQVRLLFLLFSLFCGFFYLLFLKSLVSHLSVSLSFSLPDFPFEEVPARCRLFTQNVAFLLLHTEWEK